MIIMLINGEIQVFVQQVSGMVVTCFLVQSVTFQYIVDIICLMYNQISILGGIQCQRMMLKNANLHK